MPRHPIPAVLFARLAVDRSVQGRGLGAFLLAGRDGAHTRRVGQVGIRVMLVHALDEDAAGSTRTTESNSDDLMGNLQLIVKDMQVSLRQGS